MKKLLIIAALLPTLLFGQQAKNVQVAPGETFDENNIVVSAGGTRLKSIPVLWTSGNSTLSLTGNITLTGNVIANGIGGANANGQVLLGNATSGDFQIGNISAGSGISLTTGPGTLQVSANQSLFQSVKVSGQNDIIATSPTANVTFSGTGGVVITTNNTTNTVTVDGSGISGGSLFTGFTTAIPTAESVPSGWSLTGVNGIPEYTTPDADYKVIFKTAGDVAAVTANVSAGEVLTGTQVLFETSTPSAAIRYTTNGTDPTRTSGTVVSGPVTITTDTTYEVIGYRDYWVDTAVGSFAYTINPIPTHSGAWTIAADGTTHTLVFSEAISFGAGGSGGFVANMSGGAVNLTYSSGTGTSSIVFTGNRTVLSTETETGNNGQYTQPGNGAEDSAGQDVATFTGHTITNNSTQSGGSPTWYYAVGWDATATGGYGSGLTDENAAHLNKVTFPSAGTVTKISFYANFVNASSSIKYAIFDSSRVLVGSGVTTTISGASGEWKDVATSISIASSGTYYIGVAMDGPYTGSIEGRQKTASSGDLYVTFDSGSYANFPASLTGLSASTDTYAIRAELTP